MLRTVLVTASALACTPAIGACRIGRRAPITRSKGVTRRLLPCVEGKPPISLQPTTVDTHGVPVRRA